MEGMGVETNYALPFSFLLNEVIAWKDNRGFDDQYETVVFLRGIKKGFCIDTKFTAFNLEMFKHHRTKASEISTAFK
jgi:hypothetical protein